jgi:hypothetical protein
LSTTRSPEGKQARARRIAVNSRAKGTQREIAQQKAAAKALAAAVPQGAVPQDRTAAARKREQREYVVGDYLHRLTGSRIRLLDTKAPDAPPDGIAPEIRPDGKALRYAVQCVDHDTGPIFYGTLRDAERAVRQSPGWCTGCAGLLMARPKVRTRNRTLAR